LVSIEKEARRVRKEQIRKRTYQRDNEGRIVIPLIVSDDADFLSVFSENTTPTISTDVAEYIAEKTDYLPSREELHLQIRSDCIVGQEQEVYRTAIREHYMTQYIRNRHEWLRNTVLSAVLAAAGLLLLVLTVMLDEYVGMPVWTEVADIAAWVFVWESVDVSVFRNHEVRREIRRCIKGMDMTIEFTGV